MPNDGETEAWGIADYDKRQSAEAKFFAKAAQKDALRIDTAQVESYQSGHRFALWTNLLTLGVFSSLFLWYGFYEFTGENPIDQERGRGMLRGTLRALVAIVVAWVIIYFAFRHA